MSIRVAYIFNSSRIIGGGEISFLDLIGEIGNHGYEPVAIVPGEGEISERLAEMGVTTLFFDMPGLKGPEFFRLRKRQHILAELFRENGIRIVHANGARCMLYAGRAAAMSACRCIWHVRVLDRDKYLDKTRAKFADLIVVNSKAVALSLSKFARVNRIEVIHNGLDLDAWRAAESIDLKEKFSLKSSRVVLGVGRFTYWKGFEDLIDACALLMAKKVEFSCLLVGEALPSEKGYETMLRKRVIELGLSEYVTFAGWQDDVKSIMKSATALVVPSHGEPFGRVIVEAWASQLPVIATGRFGPAEIIDSNINGLLVRTADPYMMAKSIATVLDDGSLRERISHAALAKLEQFTLEGHAAKVAGAYRRVSGS